MRIFAAPERLGGSSSPTPMGNGVAVVIVVCTSLLLRTPVWYVAHIATAVTSESANVESPVRWKVTHGSTLTLLHASTLSLPQPRRSSRQAALMARGATSRSWLPTATSWAATLSVPRRGPPPALPPPAAPIPRPPPPS